MFATEAIQDRSYQEARQEFLTPKAVKTGSLGFIVLFLLFIIPQFDGLKSLPGITVLVLVILFHEAGHMVGMRAFGFQDVRMYFIPFLGAAASGRPIGAAAWKHAMVSLLGPLPGILLGWVALFALTRYPVELLLTAIQTLLLLNVFNLLPFGGLDGGRFLRSVLFSRHRVLEILAFTLGSAALIIVAAKLDMPMLALFSLLGLFGLPARWRILKAAAALRIEHPALEADPTKLSDAETHALFTAARAALRATGPLPPATVATTMHAVVDTAQRPPGVLASLGLLLVYLLTWIAAFIGIIALVVFTGGPISWKQMEQPGWRAEFPTKPQAYSVQELTPDGLRPAKTVRAVHDVERFTVEAIAGGERIAPQLWIDTARDALKTETRATLRYDTPVTTAGHPGREVELANSYRIWRARIYVSEGKLYRITASAPKWGGNQQRFFESFTLVPSPAPSSPAK